MLILQASPSNTFTSSCLASPASTIEFLTKELEDSLVDNLPITKSKSPASSTSSKSSTMRSVHSLDIRQIIKGQYVVKPHDDDKSKAQGPSQIEIQRLKSDILAAAKEHSNSNSLRSSASRGSVGHYSLGLFSKLFGLLKTLLLFVGPHPHKGNKQQLLRECKQRRKSAGDENLLKQLNLYVRTRTDSGKQLSDKEILEQVTVLNLDTGERVPLSVAEEKLPQCINPLSLHIMRLTSEYVSNSSLEKEKESDEESVISRKTDIPLGEEENDPEVLICLSCKCFYVAKLLCRWAAELEDEHKN